MDPVRVTIWNEHVQDRTETPVTAIDPDGIHAVVDRAQRAVLGGMGLVVLHSWTRGLGRIVHLRPGHQTHPTYHHPDILRVIANACTWARSRVQGPARSSTHSPALEPVASAR